MSAAVDLNPVCRTHLQILTCIILESMGIFMQQFFRQKTTQFFLTVLATYLFMKYLSPFITPFLAAFLIVWAMNPYIERVHQNTRFKKSFVAGLLLMIWVMLFIWILWIFSYVVMNGGGDLWSRIPSYFSNWETALSCCCDNLERLFGFNGQKLQGFVIQQITVFTDNFQTNIMPVVMGKSVTYMKGMISCFAFLVVVFIAVMLLVKDYGEIVQKLEAPEFRGIREVFRKVVNYLKTFLRAQLIILLIISVLCAVTLSLIGMSGAVFYGFLTGFMDMLPFIGTGIMLLPLGAIYFFTGEYWKAIVCIVLYGLCALIREMLEPRLIGDKVGIWPIGIMFSVFAGVHLFGVAGVIKGPLSLVIICEILKFLWYTEEYEKDG